MKKRVAFYTLGCKVNQYETEAMVELFSKNDYEVVNENEIADVYVINTCTVTSLSDKKSRQFTRRCRSKNKEAIIAVVGCYSQVSPEEVSKIEEIDIILGTDNRRKIVELCEEFIQNKTRVNLVSDIMKVTDFEEMAIDETGGKTRAFVKIQEGCNQYCSYCIIPYARGPIRSRNLDNIVDEVKRLSENGFKEIVLTGIHIASYGKDLGNERLIDVIEAIHEVEGIKRIRLGSLEPTLVTEEFMKRLSCLKKVCNHFHLSLQSGSDTVLKRMNRKYTIYEYGEIVKIIRKHMKEVAFTTDIIVGFPGETEQEFEETFEFIDEIKFSKVHVFQYSPRKGTPAAEFKDQVNGNIKHERSKKLIDLTQKLNTEFNKKFIDKELDVLFEEKFKGKEGYIEGHTTNYIKVISLTNGNLEGQIKKVKIKSAYNDCLDGEIIN